MRARATQLVRDIYRCIAPAVAPLALGAAAAPSIAGFPLLVPAPPHAMLGSRLGFDAVPPLAAEATVGAHGIVEHGVAALDMKRPRSAMGALGDGTEPGATRQRCATSDSSAAGFLHGAFSGPPWNLGAPLSIAAVPRAVMAHSELAHVVSADAAAGSSAVGAAAVLPPPRAGSEASQFPTFRGAALPHAEHAAWPPVSTADAGASWGGPLSSGYAPAWWADNFGSGNTRDAER